MRKLLPLLAAFTVMSVVAGAQCPTGYREAALNWDGLDYFSTTGYNMNALSATMSPNQSFAFGKNRVTITYSSCTSAGENATHTGETGSYGAGQDVQYTGNGTLTLTFANEVANLKFSIYDIDMAQRVQIGAVNAANTAQNVAVSALGTSILTVTGSGTTSALVADNTSSTKGGTTTFGTAVVATSANASINVDVAGPVKSVTLTISNTGTVTSGSTASQEDGSFWLSDLAACITETYTANYYSVSRPFTGMPAYVLTAINNSVYMVDPATGRAKYIFTDGANSGTINSLAYDPYNKIAYFCWSLTNNGSTTASSKTLHRYDFTTGTVTTIANDVNSYGLPTFNQGTESGAAAFYDGALYIGIEGGADNGNGGPRTTTTGIESIVWRMTFNSSGAPENISQVYATSGDAHDWGDFAISNDTLYDYNGESGGAHYQHMSLYTGNNFRMDYVTALPRQSAVGWNGTVYNVGTTIGTYNLNGRTGTAQPISSTPAIPNWSNTGAPSFGDAAEAFRPAVDFGDAPISYDPDPLAPALHETISTLRLGATSDVEWDKPNPGTGATVDGSDEDGLAFVRIFVNGSNYQTDLRVFNNTGANATVCAWVDFNNDGQFQSTEGITQTVPTSTTTQNVSLFWNSPVSSLPNNSYSYLRIRITSAANGMTTANPTGYFGDGEVEDYYVFVSNTPLEVKLSDFTARKVGEEKVSLAWSVTEEEPNTKYELQKSAEGQSWSSIYLATAQSKNAKITYERVDGTPFIGNNYYRLKITKPNGGVIYSQVKSVVFEKHLLVHITPNPASGSAVLSIQLEQRAAARLRILDINGRAVYERSLVAESGTNNFALPVHQLPDGVYQAEVWVDTRRYTQQLLVRK
jgi:hypothetical protein